MTTVAPFVEAHLRANGYLGYCRTLFIAENYPSLSTYFYRTLGPSPYTVYNQFFNNLINALGLPANPIERSRLDNFLNNGFRLIDAFKNPGTMHPINDIYDDIRLLNPQNIVFITENNKETIRSLTTYLSAIGNFSILPKIVPDYFRGEMFHCFPGRPAHIISFNNSISLGMKLGII